MAPFIETEENDMFIQKVELFWTYIFSVIKGRLKTRQLAEVERRGETSRKHVRERESHEIHRG